jgi:hypothetical protein
MTMSHEFHLFIQLPIVRNVLYFFAKKKKCVIL